MNRITKTALMLLMLFSGVGLYSQAKVSAVIEGSEFSIGDTVELAVNLENINNLHGVYFDLEYNSEYFTFQGVDEGDFTSKNNGQLLYSKSNNLMFSYTLLNRTEEVNVITDKLLVVRFKVIKKNSVLNNFVFNNSGVKNKLGLPIEGITWNHSNNISIVSNNSLGYIAIKSPYENQVFTSNKISLDIISTPGVGYYAIITNSVNNYTSENINCADGFFTKTDVPVVSGFNKLSVSLYNKEKILIAQDKVRVYQSTEDQYVKITSPGDTSIVNTNLIEIEVESPLSNVEINGVLASLKPGLTTNGKINTYRADIWLKSGVNRIKAQAKNKEGAIFNHEIEIYYQVDDTVFDIFYPGKGQVVKGNDRNFKIIGEISSKYESIETASSSVLTENEIFVTMVHYPDSNPSQKNVILDKKATIRNTEKNENLRTQYAFEVSTDLSVENLEQGKVEIIVQKNPGKEGQEEIKRVVKLDSSNLKLELIQPNIYNSENIKSIPESSLTNIKTNTDGSLQVRLKENGFTSSYKEIEDYQDIFYDSNGAVWYIVNKYGSMILKKREKDQSDFIEILNLTNMYGYTISESARGILLGVSNLYNNDNSGLYLLEENEGVYSLKNIQIGKPITHVQYIHNFNEQIFLYGDNYSSIYSFNIFNLETDGDVLRGYNSQEIPFSVNSQISQLEITSNLKLAVVRTKTGNIKIYQNRDDYGFKEVFIDDYDYAPDAVYSRVILGEYKYGGYNSILLLGEKNRVLMENKVNGRLNCNILKMNNSETIVGAGFNNDRYTLIQYDTNNFYIDRGKISFSNFTSDQVSREIYKTDFLKTIIDKLEVEETGSGLYLNTKENGKVYSFNFVRDYYENGKVSYNYINPAIQGSTGISFKIENRWIKDNFLIGLGVQGETIYNSPLSLLEMNPLVDSVTIASEGASNTQNVEVRFKEPVSTLHLNMDLIPGNNSSPILSDLTIFNKTPFKLIKSENTLSMPIKGRVNDPTVEKVFIGQNIADVVDGEFSLVHSLIPVGSEQTVPITITAYNQIGERDEISFNVDLIDSYNGITSLSYYDNNSVKTQFDLLNKPSIEVNSNTLTIAGEYYGLKGLTIGYEVYKGVNQDLGSGILIRSGFINRTVDESIDLTTIAGVHNDNKHFYEAGNFTQDIKINPGQQVLLIYIENPGGKREEYLYNNNGSVIYPEISYTLPQDQQRIEFDNIGIVKGKIDSTSDYSLEYYISESSTIPYEYKKEFNITGSIISPFSVEKVLLKIQGNGTFEDGSKETAIDVFMDNSFIIPVVSVLPEETKIESLILTVEPNTPFLSHLKTSLEVILVKDFENSQIEPDFSNMDFINWGESDIRRMSKLLRVGFTRYIPEGTKLSLLVNFETFIQGTLVVVDATKGIYKLVDENNNQISLSGVKIGSNRIHWSLSYNGYVISSSNTLGMSEYYFDFDFGSLVFANTNISIIPGLDGEVFGKGEVPLINIEKDINSYVSVTLNEKIVFEDEGFENNPSINLNNFNLLEGNNKLRIVSKLKNGLPEATDYGFTYDSINPISGLEYERYYQDSTVDLSFIITEANLNSVVLKHNGTIIDNTLYKIDAIGPDRFRVYINKLNYNNTDSIELTCTDIVNNSNIYSHTLNGVLSNVNEVNNRNIELPIYNGQSSFPLDSERTDTTSFNKYSRVLPSTIELYDVNPSLRDSFNIVTDKNINLDIFTHGKLNLNLKGEKVDIYPGFTSSGVVNINAQSAPGDVENWSFNHNVESDSMVFTFWFRDDSQDYFSNNKAYKVLKLNDTNSIYCDGNTLYLNDSANKLSINKNIWNYIAVKVYDGKIDIVKRDNLTADINSGTYSAVNNSGVVITDIVAQGALYSFGNEDSTLNGYFSIALPYYVNNKLKNNSSDPENLGSLEDIYAFVKLTSESAGNNTEIDRVYNFNSIEEQNSPGKEYSPIVVNSNVLVSTESVHYKNKGESSLLASGVIDNLLAIKDSGITYNNETSFPQLINLSQYYFEKDILITPINIFIPGVYYFDSENSSSNRGLAISDTLDNNFTLSGYIQPNESNDSLNASIVVKVDLEEHRYELNYGDFEVVLNSQKLNIQESSSVHIYIETTDRFLISKDIRLNRGKYRAPIVKNNSAITFNSLFNTQGTVSFWYKPFNTGVDSLTSYATTLFNNDFIKIYTEVNSNNVAEYKVKIGSDINSAILDSTVPVSQGWQHIQLSYSQENNAALLYINGVLAFNSISSFDAPVAGSSLLSYLGCNTEQNMFAQGYIDDFNLSPFYKGPQFIDDLKPFNYTYIEDNLVTPEFKIESSIIPGSISKAIYTLESLDRDFKEVKFFNIDNDNNFFNHGFDIENLDSGRYRFTSTKIINDYNFKDIYYFIKNNKPCFLLTDKTPFIIPGSNNNINFKLKYDHSKLLEAMANENPAVSISLQGTKSTGEIFTEVIYLFYDANSWKFVDQYGNEGVLNSTNGYFDLSFNSIESVQGLNWDIRPYYYKTGDNNTPDFSQITKGFTGTIKSVDIIHRIDRLSDGKAYKLGLSLTNNNGNYVKDILKNIRINYELSTKDENLKIKDGLFELTENGNYEFYYDQFLPDFGEYELYLSIYYNNEALKSTLINLDYLDNEISSSISTTKNIYIEDFSFVDIEENSNSSKAKLNFIYKYNAIIGDIKYSAKCYNDGVEYSSYNEISINKKYNEQSFDIDVPIGTSTVVLTLEGDGIIKTKSINVSNNRYTPNIYLTTSIPYIIAYNNLSLSWYGTFEGNTNNQIKYSYNLDNKGWTPKDSINTLELYNLAEGRHNIKIKAIYKNTDSNIISNSFYIDTIKPVIDENNIIIEPLVNKYGITEAVNISGRSNAIKDSSIESLYIDNIPVEFTDTGAFKTTKIDLKVDGNNVINLKAVDSAGNFTKTEINYETSLVKIISPNNGDRIDNSPITIVGSVPSGMALDIYVKDPMVKNTKDYSKWKKAKNNNDGTFFVEDVYIHPGSKLREATTELEMVIITADGKEYFKNLSYRAKELRVPIKIDLSASAIEGKNLETTIDINCYADVENISSWSIDFDGDGIYEVIDMVNGEKSHNWTHTYSIVGLLKPRVRIITTEGYYFSNTKELIIHDTILDSSNRIVNNPISVTTYQRDNKDHLIYTLYGDANSAKIDLNILEKNDTSISYTEDTINLNSYGVVNPVKIEALAEDRIFVASNNGGKGYINQLIRNEYGNYVDIKDSYITLDNDIVDISLDGNSLFVTTANSKNIYKYPIEMGIVLPSKVETNTLEVQGSAVGDYMFLSKDYANIYVADYYNQKIFVLNDNLKLYDYFGNFGTEEGEFLKPSIIESYGNRIFIYDEARRDIQVFDKDSKRLITKLDYDVDSKYFEPDFLLNVSDMDVITKEEGNKIYYYGVILSKSVNKLALIRLPKWEELRAKVRNNRMTFIKDRELFVSKPSGSDLKKVLSTDAIPFINGSIDYPSLSSDGHSIVFTSKKDLDNSSNVNNYLFDKLYVVDIDNPESITRIPLEQQEGFEIERPVFSTNGDKVIFSGKERNGNWSVYVYNFETGGVEKLISAQGVNNRYPYYSPDDRYIVYTTDIDGDNEVEIFDTQNSSIRVSVSNNNAREYYPVWSELYPYEIGNTDSSIVSKIAFVSEKNYEKDIHFVYIAQKDGEFPRVVKTDGTNVGENPDSAWNLLTEGSLESSYPCYTGDGSKIVFESLENGINQLREIDLVNNSVPTNLSVFAGARRPSGMKNKITELDFSVESGNDLRVSWKRYTNSRVSYFVEYKKDNKASESTIRRVIDQDNTLIEDLLMGNKYIVRVFIKENGEEVASSSWKEYNMPEVAAVPTVTVDPDNPYLLKLHAWKPNVESTWDFIWLVDNKQINAQSLTDYYYEFATSGKKTVILIAETSKNRSISEPVEVEIFSDIIPNIEYTVAADTTYVELTAENSKGTNIDFGATTWQITGPGANPKTYTGSRIIVPLAEFKDKINVNLILKKKSIADQQNVDILERSILIDLTYQDTKPIITYNTDEKLERLLHFSGSDSLGNIDWLRAKWQIINNGAVVHSEQGVSSFSYQFTEEGTENSYVVSLTVPRQDGMGTETANSIIYMKPTPIIPEIDYEVITSEVDGNVESAKLILSASKSKGMNIDFSQTKWTMPLATKYGESATQVGPTAVYNLVNTTDAAVLEVSVTMMRRGGADVVTETKVINLKASELPSLEIKVSVNNDESDNIENVDKIDFTTDSGRMLVFDILKSTGPNIDWDRTKWQFGNIDKTGPIVRIDRAVSSTNGILPYICSVYTTGSDKPIVKIGQVDIEGVTIDPKIEIENIKTIVKGDPEEGTEDINKTPTLRELTVENTSGINIDWARTKWLIPVGNSGTIEKTGSTIFHSFPLSNHTKHYRVAVNMFYIGENKPFVKYESVKIEADEIKPVITEILTGDNNIITFSAEGSSGLNLDIENSKWTFNDKAGTEIGKTVNYRFLSSDIDKKFQISLTVLRNLSNGETESVTTFLDKKIGKTEIKPSITVTEGSELNSKTFSVMSTTFAGTINWDKTKWFLPNGNGDIIQKNGPTASYIFPLDKEDKTYEVQVHMFAEGLSKPFIKKYEITIDGVSLGVELGEPIETTAKGALSRKFKFVATQNTDSPYEIKWDQCKWEFEYLYVEKSIDIVKGIKNVISMDQMENMWKKTFLGAKKPIEDSIKMDTGTYVNSKEAGQDVFFNIPFKSNGEELIKAKFTVVGINNKGVTETEVIEKIFNVSSKELKPYIKLDEKGKKTTVLSCNSFGLYGVDPETAVWYIIKKSHNKKKKGLNVLRDSDDGLRGQVFLDDYKGAYGTISTGPTPNAQGVNVIPAGTTLQKKGKVISISTTASKHSDYFIVLQLFRPGDGTSPPEGAYVVKKIKLKGAQ